jgi:hypothetical protein
MFINHTYDLHSFVDDIYFKETGTINLTFLVSSSNKTNQQIQLKLLITVAWLPPQLCNGYRSVLASRGRIMVSVPWRIIHKTIKLIFAASPYSTQHKGARRTTGQQWVTEMCLSISRVIYLHAECCFNLLVLDV